MCGRFALSKRDLQTLLGETAPIEDRYNITPSQEILLFSGEIAASSLRTARWGFLPFWKKDTKGMQINARIEGIAAKPYFRNAWKKGRCIVPVSGYYEWIKTGEKKQPYYLFSNSKKPLLLAGLMEQHADTLTCAIVTRPAVESISQIHKRMPLILDDKLMSEWLKKEPPDPEHLIDKAANQNIQFYTVSDYVNSPSNTGEQCIIEVA